MTRESDLFAMADEEALGVDGSLAMASEIMRNVMVAKRGGKIGKVLAGAALARQGYDAYNVWKRRQLRRTPDLQRSIVIEYDDQLYGEILAYITSLVPSADFEKEHSLDLVYRWKNTDRSAPMTEWEAELSGNEFSDRVRVLSLQQAEQSLVEVEIGGCKVTAEITSEDVNKNDKEDGQNATFYAVKNTRLILYCASAAERSTVFDFLARRFAQIPNYKEKISTVYTASRYGWTSTSARVNRRPETVVLPDGVVDSVLDDIAEFRASEQWYVDWGIPWHRGYLFYGPPGTGKTSMAQVIAHKYKMDVYFLALAGVENDERLNDLISRLDQNDILVLEDIDVVKATHAREEGDSDNAVGVTLQGLLNALDGVMTPHGMIVIMTTNHEERLDSALLRDGRVDMRCHLDYATKSQIEQMVQVFTGETVDIGELHANIAPAEIMEILKQHRKDPKAAAESVVEFVAQKAVQVLV